MECLTSSSPASSSLDDIREFVHSCRSGLLDERSYHKNGIKFLAHPNRSEAIGTVKISYQRKSQMPIVTSSLTTQSTSHQRSSTKKLKEPVTSFFKELDYHIRFSSWYKFRQHGGMCLFYFCIFFFYFSYFYPLVKNICK